MATDVHQAVLTNFFPNSALQATTTVCRDHYHKNNQPTPTITAKNQQNANTNTNITGCSYTSKDEFNKLTPKEQIQHFVGKCYHYFDKIDDDAD